MASKKRIVILSRCERHFLESFYFQKLKYGIDAAVEETDYQVVLSQQENNFLDNISKEDLKNTGFLNIAPHVHHPSVVLLEKKAKSQAMLINCRADELSWVDVDNKRGVRTVVEHLIKLGREKILFINGFQESQNAIDRLEGLKHTLETHSVPFDQKLVISCDFSITLTYERVKAFLQQKSRPEFNSIFAGNDLMAVGAIRALTDEGYKVPQDIAVVGYDDFDFAATFQVPLTTYRQPFNNIGFLATRLLMDQIGHKPGTHQAELIGELIVRESCGGK